MIASPTVSDAWGDRWVVAEARPTVHGFEVLLGYPIGGGRGGKRAIVTDALVKHFEVWRSAPGKMALPIGGTTIKRIRRLLGHHRQIDNAAWWDERIVDLIRLTAAEFAAAHATKETTAAVARIRLLGTTQRPTFWWRAPEVMATLLSGAPTAEIADALGVAAVTARKLRIWAAGHPPPPSPGR